MSSGVPMIGIAGYKNAGKTTLAVRLIEELTYRHFAVSTIKHAHHSADIDQPGTDSYRHRQSGANEVALITPERVAIMRETRDAPKPNLFEVAARLAPADVIIVEGFRSEKFPKIEVRRKAGPEYIRNPRNADAPKCPHQFQGVVAIASDTEIPESKVPVLPLDDISAIVEFIIELFELEISDASA